MDDIKKAPLNNLLVIIDKIESSVKSGSIIAAMDEINREIARLKLKHKDEVEEALRLGFILRLKQIRAISINPNLETEK